MIRYYGEFKDVQGRTVSVEIRVQSSVTKEIEIGTDASGVWFADDPVSVTSEMEDTFDVLLRHSARVTLLSRTLLGDLFCKSCMDAAVQIRRDGDCLFAGYVVPQTYSQPYSEVLDEIEVNCIDALSALQYSRYKGAGTRGHSYSTLKAEAGIVTLKSIVADMLHGAGDGLAFSAGDEVRFWYDGSRQATPADASKGAKVFDVLAVSELLFLGDEEDDVWQADEVLESVLKYLDLHVEQVGLDFYVFGWDTVKTGEEFLWYDLEQAASGYHSLDVASGVARKQSAGAVTLSLENAADTGTQVSFGDVYNRLVLKCEVESLEKLIESPLDSDLLVSPYTNCQKYVTEYSADGEGTTAKSAFEALCKGEATTYEHAVTTDWYVQVRDNRQWTFPKDGTGASLVDSLCSEGTNQQDLPNWLSEHIGAAVLSVGKIEKQSDAGDNAPVSKVSMEEMLVVSVNGNGLDAEGSYRPNGDDILSRCPVAVYNGKVSGGVLSPPDEETTNYVVISGKMVLNPLMEMTKSYGDIVTGNGYFWFMTVPSRDNKDGRYYTRQYWKAETPRSAAEWDRRSDGWCPFTGKGPEEYEYKYSSQGSSSDVYSKVPVLQCMLIVGDKCVVETGSQGRVSDFRWQPYKERSECADDAEYYAQSFAVGFDPKIGDKLLGREFSLQNNIDYTMGIDAEGTAIPVRKSDKVSGSVRFMILGPVDVLWGDVKRRHPSFWRHTKWSTDEVPLLAHVSSIIVKGFEVKLYSDNGLVNNSDDGDIVYMSRTSEEFVNEKDDLEFKISSALSAEDRKRLGVAEAVSLSTVLDAETGLGVLTIYDAVQGETASAEQMYVNRYYQEWRLPRLQMTTTLRDEGGWVSRFKHYRHPAEAGRRFFVEGVSRNLKAGEATLTLKESEK